ncbi:hypothetical protein CISIN_1g037914mg [Citrus sinensis]|uniref:Uncharacterized protein n=1 Tax=Citrus sinensis TaxID=2711 RepID=A0A067DYS1_CITSI|nr:hypothetical protein CISIN_1g037914mg [Citrus sinensis]
MKQKNINGFGRTGNRKEASRPQWQGRNNNHWRWRLCCHVENVGVASVMNHISTSGAGGGAGLELPEGKELPVVVAFDEATPVAV